MYITRCSLWPKPLRLPAATIAVSLPSGDVAKSSGNVALMMCPPVRPPPAAGKSLIAAPTAPRQMPLAL